jgi:hypothetical protein
MIETVPLAQGFGVELRGVGLVDVASSDAAYRAVRALFEAHSLLLFRDQDVTDDVQAAYSRAFGPLERVKVGSVGHGTFYSRLNNLDAEGRIVPADHRQVWRARANQLWHTDSSFKETPALASVLSARRLPSGGGETEFTSTRLAWARLSPERQARLKDRIVTHSYANSRDQIHPDLMIAARSMSPRTPTPSTAWVTTRRRRFWPSSSPKRRPRGAPISIAGTRATWSCGTTAPRCIAAGPGHWTRRASWCAPPSRRATKTAWRSSGRRRELLPMF